MLMPFRIPGTVQARYFSVYRAARRVRESSWPSPFRWCSELCSDRVGKAQIGTRKDGITLGRFSAGNCKNRCDSRRADQALVGLANRRFRPLSHLTTARKLSINEMATYTPDGERVCRTARTTHPPMLAIGECSSAPSESRPVPDDVKNGTRSLVNCSGSSQWNACPKPW
jgi:hypothetical protein